MIIFLKINEEIGHLIGTENSDTRRQLLNQFREKFGGAFEAEFHSESALNVRLLQQQLEGRSFPHSLKEQHLTDAYYQAHFKSGISDNIPDVIILSIEPDLCLPLWRHKTEGYYLSPEPGWEQKWTESQQRWLKTDFDLFDQTSPENFQSDLAILVEEYFTRWNAAVLVLNASTIDPDDNLYTYRGLEDTLPLRTNQFNLALLRISMEKGISIVDVDRMVSEAGAAHVLKSLHYSDEVNRTILQEIIRIIEDLGLVQNEQPISRLVMPYVDLMVKEGVILTWHKKVGEQVNVGDKLVDLEAEFRKLKRTQSSLHLSRGKSSKAGGKMERVLVRLTSANSGILHKIYVETGTQVQEGTLIAAISENGLDLDNHPEIDIHSAAKFNITVQKLNIGTTK
jgi:hypothetical protein